MTIAAIRNGSVRLASSLLTMVLTLVGIAGCDADLEDMNRCHAWGRAICGAACVASVEDCVERAEETCAPSDLTQENWPAPSSSSPYPDYSEPEDEEELGFINDCIRELRGTAGDDFSTCVELPLVCGVTGPRLREVYGARSGAAPYSTAVPSGTF